MAGVTPTGFTVKTLDQIKQEIDSNLKAAFGTGFDTSLETPQGQITAVMSDAVSSLWELSQSVYSSLDIRQATGRRLDQLGEFRRVTRLQGESDADYRVRLIARQNPTQAAIGRLVTAVSNVPGVTYVQPHYNDTGTTNRSGMTPLTLSLVVQGGDNIAVAQAIADNLVFGLGLLGNTTNSIDDNGVCRTIRYVRPETVDFTIDVVTKPSRSTGGCGGTSVERVKSLLKTAFDDAYNTPGPTVTYDYLSAVLFVNGIGLTTFVINDGAPEYNLLSHQLANLDTDDITVTIGTG